MHPPLVRASKRGAHAVKDPAVTNVEHGIGSGIARPMGLESAVGATC